MFELTPETASAWLISQNLLSRDDGLEIVELTGGVSGLVLAVKGPGVHLVLKQPRARLRVAEVWEATLDRMDSEVAAAQLLFGITPDAVPGIQKYDAVNKIVAMEALPDTARNWQVEIAEGRVHGDHARWAGVTLGTWHARTAGRAEVASRFGSLHSFEQLRLAPFHETVMERKPELAPHVAAYVKELRGQRRCFVDGDYAPKNILVASDGCGWVLDFEVAHYGNPVFDVAFFLSFVVLSAICWPRLTRKLHRVGEDFLSGYTAAAGDGFAGDIASIAGHTACLLLARTEGKSPASFLDTASCERARAIAIDMLGAPKRGLWSWL